MEHRSRFFGTLAGVGLLFGVPAYHIGKEVEAAERGSRVVLNAALAQRTWELGPHWADRHVVAIFQDYQVRFGPMQAYKVYSVNSIPYGPSEVKGSVKRGHRWFRFTMVGNSRGRPYEYEEIHEVFNG